VLSSRDQGESYEGADKEGVEIEGYSVWQPDNENRKNCDSKWLASRSLWGSGERYEEAREGFRTRISSEEDCVSWGVAGKE